MKPGRLGGCLLWACLSASSALASEPYFAPAPAPAAEHAFQETADDAGALYGSADYLFWWMRRASVPALVTRGDFRDPGVAGALDQPGTVVLFGNGSIGEESNHGGRITAGWWLGSCRDLAVEASFFLLAQSNQSFTAAEPGTLGTTDVLALPFIDETVAFANAQQIGLPGQAGVVHVEQLQRLIGAEANLRARGARGDGLRVDWLAGFRFLGLDDNIDIDATFTDLTGQAFLARGDSAESFSARNRFYGGQLGAEAQWQRERLSIALLGKIALGGTVQTVNIKGATFVVDSAGGPTTTATGLFAQPTNIGRHERGAFAVVPEIAINLGYQIRERVRLQVGYTLLYDSSVVRAADHIDPVSNTPTLNGPLPLGQTRPAFIFEDTDFWAHGIHFGLGIQF